MFGDLVNLDYNPDFTSGWGDVAGQLPTFDAPSFDAYSPQFGPDVSTAPDLSTPSTAPTFYDPDFAPEMDQPGPGGLEDVARQVNDVSGVQEMNMPGPGEQSDVPSRGFWGSVGDFAKEAAPWAQLGLQGLGAAQGVYGMVRGAQQQGIQREAQRRQSQIAQQQQQQAAMSEQRGGETYGAGREAYDRAMRGEVPPAINQQIENWKRGAKQMARSRAASSDQGDSTMITQWEQWIEQQGEAMKGQWIKSQQDYYLAAGEASNRFSQTGVQSQANAGTTTNQQVTGAQQEQQSIEKLIQSANNIIARLSAST